MKNQRLGMLMIAATLLVIAVIVTLLFEQQSYAQRIHVRTQGVGTVKALSNVPYEQLLPRAGQSPLLNAMMTVQSATNFGYGVIVDARGTTIAEVTSPGTLVPPTQLSLEPAASFGEHSLVSPGDGRTIREFYAPLLYQGRLGGFIRLGYFEPDWLFSKEQLSFFALLALPIFLLTPLFYFLIQRETKPLKEISIQLQRFIGTDLARSTSIHPTGELRDFIRRFNQFLESTQSRVQKMQDEQVNTITSNRLLSYKKDRVESVLQALPDALLVFDQNGCVTFANEKLILLFGAQGERLIGQNPKQFCLDQKVLGFLSHYHNRPSQSYRIDGMEYIPESMPDKRIVLTAYPLLGQGDEGSLLGTAVVFRDVTQEHSIKKAGAEFVAHVSHELKTPLNTIAMYSETLRAVCNNSDALQVEATNVIHDEVKHMASLINDLLSISKIETGSIVLERSRVKVHDLLNDAFNGITQSSPHSNLQFELRLPADMSAVALDKSLFRIAINNLLTNAIKYNRPGGRVTLEADETESQILITVKDEGIGIAKEDQERIFEKFFRAGNGQANGQVGHGLGLHLAKEIVELHHGQLSVRSVLNEGSEFTIALERTSNLLKETI